MGFTTATIPTAAPVTVAVPVAQDPTERRPPPMLPVVPVMGVAQVFEITRAPLTEMQPVPVYVACAIVAKVAAAWAEVSYDASVLATEASVATGLPLSVAVPVIVVFESAVPPIVQEVQVTPVKLVGVEGGA